MSEYRVESDSLGEVRIPKNRYWGAQTQRSIENFPFETIAKINFPVIMIHSLGIIKQACAEVNTELDLIPKDISIAIIKASKEVAYGKFDDEFPLVIMGTGSGTNLNMNANEVIANRAIEIMGGRVGTKTPVHPNNHVNKSQSSNDVIPTAMHLSAVSYIKENLLPSLEHLKHSLGEKTTEFADIVKVGRTHLQDATPVTLGQEFSGYKTQIEKGITRVSGTLPHLYEIALGGTAVGTGLNSHPKFAVNVANRIADLTGFPIQTGRNKFEGIAAHDAIVETSGACRVIAVSLMKIANDIQWLGSGPRSGLGELILPANEPGSSIMPGKINPTQAESVTQVVAQVLGNDVTIGFAGSQGNLELNVFKPVLIYNLLQSIQLLSNVSRNFADFCISGLSVNRKKIERDLEQNLMLVTKLSPLIGYEKAAEIAHEAYENNLTLREVILKYKLLDEQEIDKILDPKSMTSP
ncbi:MAG: class II fumarate hydratase [Candidatus Hodarchaeales archaeon]|jgi:fumarate hydratase class II